MWICKKCGTENKEISSWCKKCDNERVYSFSFLRFLLVTLALSTLSISFILLSFLNLSSFLGVVYLFTGCGVYLIMAAIFVVDRKPKYSGVISVIISFLLCIVSMCVFSDYEFHDYLELYKIQYTIVSLILIFGVATCGIIYAVHDMKESKIILNKLYEKQSKAEKDRLRNEKKKYGRPTKTIEPYGYDRHSPKARIFTKTRFIEINGRKLKFSDIVDYSIKEYVNSDLHMSKPSMIRRGIVGGLLYGKVGAFVGVATADQYLETKVDYTISIRLKNGQTRNVFTQDVIFLDKLCAELDCIICQNLNNSSLNLK